MRAARCFAFLFGSFIITATSNAINISTVSVGNPGNAGDTWNNPDGWGSVPYAYRIGKHEVTNGQYVEFLNGVDPSGANTLALYDTLMTSNANGGIVFNSGAAGGDKYSVKNGRGNNPVVFVSWYDSIRFANWLHNGQGSGDTENGAYTLLGGTSTPINGNIIVRNPGAKWWLPNEDEWYKAAFYNKGAQTFPNEYYWEYPTRSFEPPKSIPPPGTNAPDQSNTANWYWYGAGDLYDAGYAVTLSDDFDENQNYLTDVGAYTLAVGPYGTFDQGGNADEWNETPVGVSSRLIRGGSWAPGSLLIRPDVKDADPSTQTNRYGFRVATIPEPSTLLLVALAGFGLLFTRRMRNS
jgi:formylglycine-generating enzyme required for sulfatase activity